MTRSIQPTMKSERERESRTERETLSQYVCVDVFFMIRALIRTQWTSAPGSGKGATPGDAGRRWVGGWVVLR